MADHRRRLLRLRERLLLRRDKEWPPGTFYVLSRRGPTQRIPRIPRGLDWSVGKWAPLGQLWLSSTLTVQLLRGRSHEAVFACYSRGGFSLFHLFFRWYVDSENLQQLRLSRSLYFIFISAFFIQHIGKGKRKMSARALACRGLLATAYCPCPRANCAAFVRTIETSTRWKSF